MDLWMKVCTGITCILSMLGCVVIISSYARWRDLRSKSRLLLACLSVGDYMNAVGNGVSALSPPTSSDDIGCKMQAVLTTYGSLCSFFWTSCIAIYLYITIVKSNGVLADRLITMFHVVSWIMPAVITGVAFSMSKLGYTEHGDTAGWCWINGDITSSKTQMWMVVTGKGWEILSYIIVVLLYVLIKVHLWQEKRQPSNLITKSSFETAQSKNRKLTLVPIVFVLLRMWGTIRFFLVLFNNTCALQNHFLIALHGIGDSAQGFVNFIIFCIFTERVRSHWLNPFSSCFSCFTCRRRRRCRQRKKSRETSRVQLHSDSPEKDANSPLLYASQEVTSSTSYSSIQD